MSEREDQSVAQALAEVRTRIHAFENEESPRQALFDEGRARLEHLRRRRLKGDARLWEGAQRAAFRTVVLAVGCVSLITGAQALDTTIGGVAIVLSFGVLIVEGMR